MQPFHVTGLKLVVWCAGNFLIAGSYLIYKGDVCVCVFAMRGYSDELVETKLGMVIEGPKAEVTEGFMAAGRSRNTCHAQRIEARVRFNWIKL